MQDMEPRKSCHTRRRKTGDVIAYACLGRTNIDGPTKGKMWIQFILIDLYISKLHVNKNTIYTGRSSRTIVELVIPEFLTPNFVKAGLITLVWYDYAVMHNRIHID
jgi:hypothetical protein